MGPEVEAWAAMADYWNAKLGDEGDLWHRALIDPTTLRVLGPVAGLDLLDLACGNGYLSRRLARQGARVTAVDASAPIIAHARAHEAQEPLGIAYHVADAAHLDPLPDAAFDAVLCNMALMDIADAERALREVGRVLRPRGRLVASISHPCFDQNMASGWLVEKFPGTPQVVWRKVSRYRELFEGKLRWRIRPGEMWETSAFHRPLAWYLRALRAAGLAVVALEEPEPVGEMLADDDGPLIAQIPLHCVIEAWKLL